MKLPFSPLLLIVSGLASASDLNADPEGICFSEGREQRNSTKRMELVTDLVIGTADGDDTEIFGKVADIAVDTRGRIYVLDSGYDRVQSYDSSGRYIQTIGRDGEGPGEFSRPTAIAVDKSNSLYVADRSCVSVFDADGTYVDKIRHELVGGVVRSIRVHANMGVYLSCFTVFEQKIIHRYNYDHQRLFSFCDSYAIGQDIDVRVELACAGGDIDIDDEGVIYFTQTTPYEIRKYSPEGGLISKTHRDNNFMRPPSVVHKSDGGMILGPFPGSHSIIVFPDMTYMNIVKVPPDPVASEEARYTVIDVFDNNGRLVASEQLNKNITPLCRDSTGRLYASYRGDYPMVVRYVIFF
jgi:hypothetical protein